jgi:hypothetical protein
MKARPIQKALVKRTGPNAIYAIRRCERIAIANRIGKLCAIGRTGKLVVIAQNCPTALLPASLVFFSGATKKERAPQRGGLRLVGRRGQLTCLRATFEGGNRTQPNGGFMAGEMDLF